MAIRVAKFHIGEVVRHRIHPFRGVIFDVDPTFANTDEWWQSIPEETRPKKDQPFYHLLAENEHRLPMLPATAELERRLDGVLERAQMLKTGDSA